MDYPRSISVRKLGKSVLLGLSYFLIVIGFIGWVGGFLLNMEVISYHGELPWGDCKGFTVDHNEIVYVGSGFYGVVETYDTSGSFLAHFPARAGGGSFSLELDSIDQVVITTARGNNRFTVNSEGSILQRSKTPHDLNRPNSSGQITSARGNVYRMGDTILPSIERNGVPYINQDFALSLIAGPFPAFLYVLAGMALNVSLRKDALVNSFRRL